MTCSPNALPLHSATAWDRALPHCLPIERLGHVTELLPDRRHATQHAIPCGINLTLVLLARLWVLPRKGFLDLLSLVDDQFFPISRLQDFA
jgi:hypothetical protein